MTEIEVTETRLQGRWIPQLGKQFFIHRRKKVEGGCWAIGEIGLFWPEQIAQPNLPHYAFPSIAHPGWYWHNICGRSFHYLRNTTTGELSDKKVFLVGGDAVVLSDLLLFFDSEFFEGVGDTTSWYNPSAEEVTEMVAYISPRDCSGDSTGTMEVIINVRMWRERQWIRDELGRWTAPFWVMRTGNESDSWPQIQELAWRYV